VASVRVEGEEAKKRERTQDARHASSGLSIRNGSRTLLLPLFLLPLTFQVAYNSMSAVVDSLPVLTPSQLVARVPDAYDQGIAAGAVFFFPSTSDFHNKSYIDVRLSQPIVTRR